MDTVRMAELTRGEITALADGGALLVIPIGATEQHGEHLAVATDHVISSTVAERAAMLLRDDPGCITPVIVAPALAYGHSHHHLPFGGTLSLTPATLQQVLIDLGATAVESGFSRVFFLNGHGGNVDIAAVAAREVARLTGVPVGSGSYWVMAAAALATRPDAGSTLVPGHAGHFETSVALAIDPRAARDQRPVKQVDASQRPTGAPDVPYVAAQPWFWHTIDGWTDDATEADAAAGNDYLDVIVTAVASHLRQFAEHHSVPPVGYGG